MRVLVIGNGAREHALVSRLATDPAVSHLICAPGNPGTARAAEQLDLRLSDPDAILALAIAERIDLTVVGPEAPLSIGVADRFAAAGLLLLGPTAAAARLESSKAFAKDFMLRWGVPTARFRVCDAEQAALAAIHDGEFGFPVVVKADGLAAGKGVVIAADRAAAEDAVARMMRDRRFGDAGGRVVIEECMTGPEVSFFVLSDGGRAVPIGAAQDHKRIFDADRGPNTGGMGAFAPSPLIDSSARARIMDTIVAPVIAGMAAEGHPFRGFLYVGLMLTADGPRVIEFNVRLGDPEAQVILPLVDEPLLPLLTAAASGDLRQASVAIGTDKLVGVVLASRGYPDSSESGVPIHGVGEAEREPGVAVFHAGTVAHAGSLMTNGGRVLTVTGRGADFGQAIARAYAGVARISFDGMQYRRDIGQKALSAK
ncbi:MAG TPA: phosphoribosylamine--glycine ligase [Vicinamibacterales bacterium]